MPTAADTPDVARRGRRVPERSIHHARVRALVRDAVRAASVREDQRIGIELDDARVRARDHVVLESSSRDDDAPKRRVGEVGSLPPLAIVMLVVGTRGDVQPLIPIARRLARDGHRVRLATHAVFRDLVESHGLEFYPLAGDPRQLIDYMVMTGGHLLPRHLGQAIEQVPRQRALMAEILVSTWAACTERDPGRPDAPAYVADVVIANPPSQGHIHVAEALRAPLHIMFTMPWSPTREFPHPLTHVSGDVHPGLRNRLSFEAFDWLTWLGLADLVNDFRERTLGLERVHLGDHGASLLHDLAVPHAYLWSPSLLAKPSDWGAHVDVTGFVFLDQADRFRPPASLQAFLAAGAPPVYVGFGSCTAPDPDALTSTIFDGLARAGVRGLVSRGWARLGTASAPAHVHLVDDVPHDWLFPRCAAVCHHGGAGTTAAGLRSGLPTIVVPFFGDQHFWGRIVAEAGAGPEPVPVQELTAESLADAIAFALRPDVRASALVLGERVRAQAGVEETVAAFYKRLPLERMRCDLDDTHLARRFCRACELVLCGLCDAVVHEERARAMHRREPFGHVAWDVPGSPAIVEWLERAIARTLGTHDETPPEAKPGEPPTIVGVRDREDAAQPAVDDATRALILERFETVARAAARRSSELRADGAA